MKVEPLLNLGLSPKEAEVYLAAMQLGYATVMQIAQKAEINRTTAYTHIRNLISRGLMSTAERGGRPFFVASRPEVLKEVWEQQEQEIRRRKETLDQLMPELQSLYNLAADRPSVKLYDASNLSFFREQIVNHRADQWQNIFNYEQFKEFIDAVHIKRLLESTLMLQSLYIAKQKILDRRLLPFINHERFKIRYLPHEKFNFMCEVLIGDKVTYLNRQSEYLTITDPQISATFRILFQVLWGLAEDFYDN